MSMLPGVEIPVGFVGTFVPPSEYGKLLSPPIIVKTPETVVLSPQFATDKGQQIGDTFYLYGTVGTVSNEPDNIVALGSNYDVNNHFGSRPSVPLVHVPVSLQVSFTPVVSTYSALLIQKTFVLATQLQNSPTLAANKADTAMLASIVGNLSVLSDEAEGIIAAQSDKVELSQGVKK